MASKPLSKEEIAAQFGFAIAFFNSVPELKSLLAKAQKGKWTPARVQSAFMNTKWFRSNESSVRTWVALEKGDPATAKARIGQQVTKLQNMVAQLGVTLDAKTLEKVAKNSLMFSWNDDVLRTQISHFYKYEQDKSKGQAATLEASIRKAASDYGVGVTSKQLQDLIQGSIAGKYTEDHINDLMKDQAKSKYAGLRADLDKGFTVRQIASPYVNSYSELMELDADTIDLNDSYIQKALQGKTGPDGKPTERQSVWEFERELRKDPRWAKTRNGRSAHVDATLKVLTDMGIVAS